MGRKKECSAYRRVFADIPVSVCPSCRPYEAARQFPAPISTKSHEHPLSLDQISDRKKTAPKNVKKRQKKNPNSGKWQKKNPNDRKRQKKNPNSGKWQKKNRNGGKWQKKDPNSGKWQKKDPNSGKWQKKDPNGWKWQKKNPNSGKRQKKDPNGGKRQKKNPNGGKKDVQLADNRRKLHCEWSSPCGVREKSSKICRVSA